MIYKGTTKLLDLENLSPIYPNPLYDEPESEANYVCKSHKLVYDTHQQTQTIPFVSTEVFDKSYKYRPSVGQDLITYPVEKHDKSTSESHHWSKWPHFSGSKCGERASTRLHSYISFLKTNRVEAIQSGQSDEEDKGSESGSEDENENEETGESENGSEDEDKDEDEDEDEDEENVESTSGSEEEDDSEDKVMTESESGSDSEERDMEERKRGPKSGRRKESALQKSYKVSPRLRFKHPLPPVPLHFRCNAAHDVEGCNWILLWTFFQHIPEDGVCDYEEGSGPYNQLEEAQNLFPSYCKSVYIVRALMLEKEHLLHNTWHKSLPTQYSAARDAVGVTFRILYDMHRNMQKYNPVLPEPRFHVYSSLIWFYNYLATLPKLQFRIKFLSQYRGKSESPLEMEYCPKVEPVDRRKKKRHAE